jgi:hypothetical protein
VGPLFILAVGRLAGPHEDREMSDVVSPRTRGTPRSDAPAAREIGAGRMGSEEIPRWGDLRLVRVGRLLPPRPGNRCGAERRRARGRSQGGDRKSFERQLIRC